MFGFISNAVAGLALIAFGNVFLGCAALVGAGVWLMTRNVGGDE